MQILFQRLYTSNTTSTEKFSCESSPIDASIHQFTHIHSSIHPYPFTNSPISIHRFTHSRNHSVVNLFTHIFVHTVISSPIHPSINSPIRQSIHLLIHPSIHSIIHPLTHSPIYPSIHKPIHSFITSSLQGKGEHNGEEYRRPQGMHCHLGEPGTSGIFLQGVRESLHRSIATIEMNFCIHTLTLQDPSTTWP